VASNPSHDPDDGVERDRVIGTMVETASTQDSRFAAPTPGTNEVSKTWTAFPRGTDNTAEANY
jgi:hypothetical protein